MNVLQICYKYPPLFSGYGKQLHTINQRMIQDEPYIDVRVLTAYGKQSRAKVNENLTVYSLFRDKREGAVFYFIFSVFAIFKYFLLFLKSDVVHIVKAGPELIAPTILSKVFRKRVIIKVAQDDLENLLLPRLGILRWVRKKCILKADFVIALSEKIAMEAKALGVLESRISRIPNAIDFTRFNIDYVLRDDGVKKTKSYIFVGAVSKRKGVDTLLDALDLYDGEKIKVTFVGHIVDVPDFHCRLNSINKKGRVNVVYNGPTDCPEELLKQHDCLVLPSLSEGMPNVVLEAAACGLYLILSDIPVHKEVLRYLKGDVFKASDALSLSLEIERFNLVSYLSGFREEQYVNALAKHSVESVSSEYLKLYSAQR